MEGIAEALLNIHDALDLPSDASLLPNAVEQITSVYALIFFLLTEFMDWYVRRSTCQLLNIHSQDVYSEFSHLVMFIQRQAHHLPWPHVKMDLEEQNLKDAEEHILESGGSRALWEDARLSQVGKREKERQTAAQNTITRRLIWEIQQDAEERDKYRKNRDSLLANTLCIVRERLESVNEQNSGIVCMTTPPIHNIGKKFMLIKGSGTVV